MFVAFFLVRVLVNWQRLNFCANVFPYCSLLNCETTCVYKHPLWRYWVNPSKRRGMDRGFPRAGRAAPREIPRSSPASPRKTPSIQTLSVGFTFYLKKDFLVIFFNFFYIDVWWSITIAKLLEYVSRIVRVYIVLLCHWYLPKIQFYLMQKRRLCIKHREYNGLSLLLLERQIILHLSWCNKLVAMLGLKLWIKLGATIPYWPS